MCQGTGLLLGMVLFCLLPFATPRDPPPPQSATRADELASLQQRHPDWISARYHTNRWHRLSLWISDHILAPLFRRLGPLGRGGRWLGLILLSVLLVLVGRFLLQQPPRGTGTRFRSPPITPVRRPAVSPATHLQEAQRAARSHAWREAIHYAYRALALAVADLCGCNAATSTGRELVRALQNRESEDELTSAFQAVYSIYERTWFGLYPADEDQWRTVYETVSRELERLRQ